MPMNVKMRNVSLMPENEAFITSQAASGRSGSASEVVRAALRLLEQDKRRREAHGQQDGHYGESVRASASPEG